MKRKAYAIGFLALGLTVAGAIPFSSSRIATSRRNFQQYFRDLDPAGSSLNPVERFVFSLVLAHTDAHGEN